MPRFQYDKAYFPDDCGMKADNISITIEHDTCDRCRKCVQVCPAAILTQEKKKEAIRIEHTENCILCGHCADACPTGSLRHSAFPPERLHPIDYSRMPTPEQLMLLIKARRSNRALSSRAVPADKLGLILEAAGYAPTASNRQQVSCTVITDPDKLREIADFTIGTFDAAARKLENPIVKCLLKPFLRKAYQYLPTLTRLKEQDQAGKDPILRKATCLILFHTPASASFGSEDANLAYQNASLMAQSLGVSQIYMGYVMRAIGNDRKGSFSRITGVDGKIRAIMALGMPLFRYPRYAER